MLKINGQTNDFLLLFYYFKENSLKNSKSGKIKTLLQFLDQAAIEKRFTTSGSTKILNNTVETICCIKQIRLDVHQP